MHSLEETYRRYFDGFKRREWSTVMAFAHPQVIHNDRSFTPLGYVQMIQDSLVDLPSDLEASLEMLVADDKTERVAARIRFDAPSLGKASYEHVFYQFREDRIVQVWSLLQMSF